MDTQLETLKKLHALLLLISEVSRSIPTGLLSEAGKLLQQKLTESACAGPTDEITISNWNDVVWHASLFYKDRPIEGLSETEQKLVAKLQEGGFLTKDPGHELAPSFAPQ